MTQAAAGFSMRAIERLGGMGQLTVFKAIILGALQGATEFLPVSSSGHLVIAQDLLGVQLDGGGLLAFDVCLHFGTLIAVFAAFWRDILSIICGIFGFIPKQGFGDDMDVKRARFTALWIVIGTVPAVVVVFLFKDFFETLTTNALAAAFMLLVTGSFLWLTRFAKERTTGFSGLGFWRTIAIGCAQAVAILPGISRSGSTISMALFTGIDRNTAARFSFLLAIPAIGGAMVLSLGDLAMLSSEILTAVIAGTIVSALVGFLCIKLLLIVIGKGRFSMFAYYCWAVGLIVIIYKLFV